MRTIINLIADGLGEILGLVMDLVQNLSRGKKMDKKDASFLERYGKAIASMAVLLMVLIIIALRAAGIIQV